MNGGERTSHDRLDAVTIPADLGKTAKSGGGRAGASVPDGNGECPNTPGRGVFVQPQFPEASTGPAGRMVNGFSEL